jgi:hypothetical protein
MAMKFSQLLSVLPILSFVLTACGNGAAATEAPASTETPAQTQTEAPGQGECQPSDPPSFNEDKRVSFVLPALALPDPGDNGVILQVTPLLEPPAEDLTSECGVIIGSLTAVRSLPLSDQQVLTEGREYLVKVQQGVMHFVSLDGEELITSLPADVREIQTREVTPPEALITIKDICYSWLQVQVCTEPSPSLAIPDQQQSIQDAMQGAVTTLEQKGFIQASDINVAGAIPDMVGPQALEMQQASLVAAPTVNFPSASGQEQPDNGALLGVVVVVLPIEQDGVTLFEGPYAVFAQHDPSNQDEWQGLFVAQDGAQTYVPAKYIEVRGQIEKDGPLAIVIDLRICLCFFECR